MPELARIGANITYGTTTAEAVQTAIVGVVPAPDPGRPPVDISYAPVALQLSPGLQLRDDTGALVPGNVKVPPRYRGREQAGGAPAGVTRISFEVGAQLEDCIRTWSMAYMASTDTGDRGEAPAENAFGYEVTRGDVPPGRTIPMDFILDVFGQRRDDDHDFNGDDVSIALLTSGFPENQPSRVLDLDGHIATLQGRGPESLFYRRKVSIVRESGHGDSAGEMAAEALEQAGVDLSLIDIDSQIGPNRQSAVSIKCVPLGDVLHELLRPFGFVVLAGRDDAVFRSISLQVEDHEVSTVLGPHDLDFSAGVDLGNIDGLAARCAEVTGERPADDGMGPDSGSVTVTVFSEVRRDGFQLRIAIATQDALNGVITPTGTGGLGAPQDDHLIELTTTSTTTIAGCLAQVYTKFEKYNNPVEPRYLTASPPTLDGLPRQYNFGFFLDTVPDADDSQQMLSLPEDRFMTFSETWEEPFYDDDGFRTLQVTRTSGWANIEAALKNRADITVKFEDVLVKESLRLEAAGRPVLFEQERYFRGTGKPDDQFPSGPHPTDPSIPFLTVSRHLTQAETDEQVDICRFVEAEVKTRTFYGAQNGVRNLYNDGSTRLTENFVGVTESDTERRTQGQGFYSRTRFSTDIEGEDSDRFIDRGPTSGMPRAVRCTAADVLRDSAETVVHTVCIERIDSEGEAIDDGTEPLRLTSTLIETAAEAEFWGRVELDILRAPKVTLPLALPTPVLDAGTAFELDLPGYGHPRRKLLVVETDIKLGPDDEVSHVLRCRG